MIEQSPTVKYKVGDGEWQREDLYQALAFAAALRCFDTGVLNFHEGPNPIDTALQVGDYRVRQISWPAAESVAPDAAAHTFVASVAKWLEPLGDHLEAFVPSATGAHS